MEFMDMVKKEMEGRLGDHYEVALQTVRKNNNVFKRGIMVTTKGKNIAPTVYLDNFYEAYLGGMEMSRVMEEVYTAFEKGSPAGSLNLDFFMDFQEVKTKICYRLINASMNEELLHEIPYIPFLDLAISFFCPVEGQEIGRGSITIRNEHMEKWGVTVSELWKYAEKNTRTGYPAECCPFEDLLLDLVRQPDEVHSAVHWAELPSTERVPGEIPMKILTNQKRLFGAAVVLYKGYLKRLAERLGQSFYLLPSSIHEWILLLKDEGSMDEEQLKNMIHEVNTSQLEPQDVLSDSLYYYDATKKRILIY